MVRASNSHCFKQSHLCDLSDMSLPRAYCSAPSYMFIWGKTMFLITCFRIYYSIHERATLGSISNTCVCVNAFVAGGQGAAWR